jgi:hypothetical protein
MRYAAVLLLLSGFAPAADFPPALPESKSVATDRSDDFLKPPGNLPEGVVVAKEAPTVDFLFFPGQTYAGKPWSAWGESLAAGGKYYASIGDHLAPSGNAFVFEYDPATKKFRQLLDLRKLLGLPDGHYSPGKIHSRLDLGEDGWLYCSTHRGSTRVTTDQYHYKGDWIVRVHPESGKSEIVAQGPVPKHCIPASVLDPTRLIFYAGTAPGDKEEGGRFFAYDVKERKVLFDGPDGPSRAMILARSTGKVYFNPGKSDALVRYEPAKPTEAPVKVAGSIGIRAATQETPEGMVYTVSQKSEPELFSFDVKTEAITKLGSPVVGSQSYIASLQADPTGRYLYYVPGAHGGSGKDGSPVVQYDVKTKQRKVLAFLAPFYQRQYGCTPAGTYSLAVDAKGEQLFITWNVNRSGGKAWDCCALTVVHIPLAERQP